jgi:chemotaxis protein MotA
MKFLITLVVILLSILMLAAGAFSTLGFFDLDLPPLLMLINFPSIALILGGTFFQLFVTYPVNQIGRAFLDFLPRISSRKFDQSRRKKQIDKILDWQGNFQKSRQNAWSDLAKNNTNSFESYLFNLLQTNYKVEEFVELYQTKIANLDRKSSQSYKVFQTLAGSSPAFGMIGTVLGLMVMFRNFENDVQLASGIGLALMTTLYGIFFSQLIWIPAAKRVQQFYSDLKFNYDVLLEGIVLILEEKSPLYIRDYLQAKIEEQ